MKKYNVPQMEKMEFTVENIMTESGVDVVNASELEGQDQAMYNVYEENSDVKNSNVSVFKW